MKEHNWRGSNITGVKRKREDMPLSLKREVRQRCGFGCVICGCPIYDYEHIESYARVLKHAPENITLLCPNHHREKTNQLIRLEDLYEANANPHNKQRGVTLARSFSFGHENPTVALGSVAFQMKNQDFAAILIDGTPIIGFRFDDGHALLQLRVYDERNRLILKVVDSQLIHSIDLWDYEFEGSTLTLRPKLGEILMRIRFAPNENAVVIDRGTFRLNGVEVDIWPDCLAILNTANIFSGFTLIAPVGLVVGKNPRNYCPFLEIRDVPREFDRDSARKYIAAERKKMESLRVSSDEAVETHSEK